MLRSKMIAHRIERTVGCVRLCGRYRSRPRPRKWVLRLWLCYPRLVRPHRSPLCQHHRHALRTDTTFRTWIGNKSRTLMFRHCLPDVKGRLIFGGAKLSKHAKKESESSYAAPRKTVVVDSN